MARESRLKVQNHKSSNDLSKTSDRSALVGTLGVFLISLLAIPVCHGLSLSSQMEESVWVFVAGVVVCFALVPILLYAVVHRILRASPAFQHIERNEVVFFYIFCVFAFTAVVDLVLAFTLDGYVSTLRFYLDNGEPYLKSPHGCAINYWDGTVHYALYLLLTYLLISGHRMAYRSVGYFWFGSIMNSIVVFLPGNVIGKWALQVKESYFLNVPYVLFPMLFFWMRVTSTVPYAKPQQRQLSVGILPVLLIGALLVSMGLFMFRLMAVLGSPISCVSSWMDDVEPYLGDGSLYPLLQTIVYGFYFIPAYCAAIRGILFPRESPWLPDVAATLAGAAAQGQFSYIFGATHPLLSTYPDNDWIPVPDGNLSLFLLVNLFVVATPFLLLLWTVAKGYHHFGIIVTSAAESTKDE